MEDQLPDVAEFERAFGLQCEQSLREVLGATGFTSMIHYFIEHALSLTDSAERPAEFDDALSVLFNPGGAVLLESKILKRFYHSIGMKFEWNDGRVFKEEVEEALKQFRKRMPQPSTRSKDYEQPVFGFGRKTTRMALS